MKKKKRTNRAYVKLSYRWHRRIGVMISIPCLIIAISGLCLNHSKRLSLDDISITNPGIVSWYGMTPTGEATGFESGGAWVTRFENALYLDGAEAVSAIAELKGAATVGDLFIVATTDSLLLFRRESKELVEKMGGETLPSGTIRSVGHRDNRLLLDTTEGLFSAPANVSNFTTDRRDPLPLTSPGTVPEEQRDKILEVWRGKGLSLWRIVLDIHSGVFFGKIGVYFADLAAVCIVLLVISGIFNWSRLPKR